MTVELRMIEPGGPSHDQELDLRYRLLRAPLGMKRGSEWFEHELACLHVVAVQDNRVVGCVLFHPESETGGRLLQMAVDEPLQGGGLGRQLVQRLENELLQLGFDEVHLHARDIAIGFYERMGYECVGAPYVEVGIPHRTMRRRLSA